MEIYFSGKTEGSASEWYALFAGSNYVLTSGQHSPSISTLKKYADFFAPFPDGKEKCVFFPVKQ
jgi:hypothetical protein